MTTNPNTKYTTLEQSQRLKEIGFEAEADLWYDPKYPDIPMTAYNTNGVSIREGIIYEEDAGCGCCSDYKIRTDLTPSYRLDTLLLALPDKYHFARMGMTFNNEAIANATIRLNNIPKKGPEAIAAAVDLICLLKEVENNA